jgi:hypothetical protein
MFMLYSAAIILVITALGGLTLATIHFRSKGRKFPPKVLALMHGAAGAAGVIVLILALLRVGFSTLAGVSLALFVIAALGGFTLFSFHLRNKPLPSAFVAVHGLVALTALVLLLVVIFAGGALA